MSGSGTTVRWLLRERLLDELHLLVHPIVVGEGLVRLFPSDEPGVPLELLASETLNSGVLNLTYAQGKCAYSTRTEDQREHRRELRVCGDERIVVAMKHSIRMFALVFAGLALLVGSDVARADLVNVTVKNQVTGRCLADPNPKGANIPRFAVPQYDWSRPTGGSSGTSSGAVPATRSGAPGGTSGCSTTSSRPVVSRSSRRGTRTTSPRSQRPASRDGSTSVGSWPTGG